MMGERRVCVCVCRKLLLRGWVFCLGEEGCFRRQFLLLSLLSGVKRVIDDFCAEADILLLWRNSSKAFIYCRIGVNGGGLRGNA